MSHPSLRPPRWANVILWVVLIILALVALMRIVAWDDLEVFAVLNTVTLLVYLPAWAILVVAAFSRNLGLVAMAGIVAVTQLIFVYPEFSAASPVPAWTHSSFHLRLFDANVYDDNPSMAGYAAQIRQFNPQLVTLEEGVPADGRQLVRDGALNGLPYRIQIKRDGPRAYFVASQYPLSPYHSISFYGGPLIIQTTLQLPSGPQDLWITHTVAPLPGSFAEWKEGLQRIANLVRARGSNRLLLVGDFNATWGNRGFRAILDAGMTDGAAARGHALDMTWSQLVSPIPPFIRIDHILTGPGVVVTSIATGHGPGSDHRDLRATIAFQARKDP